jgi:hypothetical protein
VNRPQTLVFAAAFAIAVVAANAVGMFGNGSPNILSPGPLTLVLPAFMGVPTQLLPILGALLFALWEVPILLGRPEQSVLPIRSWILLALVAALSTAFFSASWAYGEKYEGHAFTLACAYLSACLFVASSLCGVFAFRRRSFALRLLAEALTFVWLFTYAFPYLGETP